MRKLTLSEWASVAEIVGAVLVVFSLILVVVSLERNTAALSGESDDDLFDSLRDISLTVIADPELSNTILKGQTDPASLTDNERARYLRWVSVNIDIWARTIRREQEHLLEPEKASDWHNFYEEFSRRSLTKDMWDEIKWEWGDFPVVTRVDAALMK